MGRVSNISGAVVRRRCCINTTTASTTAPMKFFTKSDRQHNIENVDAWLAVRAWCGGLIVL